MDAHQDHGVNDAGFIRCASERSDVNTHSAECLKCHKEVYAPVKVADTQIALCERCHEMVVGMQAAAKKGMRFGV